MRGRHRALLAALSLFSEVSRGEPSSSDSVSFSKSGGVFEVDDVGVGQ